MAVLLETHLHTVQASRCGRTPGREYPAYLKERGYQGLIVTDHFFNGNSAVPRELPWKERVALYASGYEDALEGAKETDFKVFFGIEYNFEGDEYLIYGPDVKWLSEQDDILSLSRKEVYERVHEAGGIMVHAHPYRERGYLNTIHLTPSVCDGIEIYNAFNDDNMNALSYEYAQELKLPMSSGSDIHSFYDGPRGAVQLPEMPVSMLEYAEAFLRGEAVPMIVTEEGARRVTEVESLTKPVHGATLPIIRH
ncbi:MAG: hypothetical protein IK115_00465 [Lachnospiraceae bacterium]|nr:hypothetical protein [Lachnospiraceae bacterium]